MLISAILLGVGPTGQLPSAAVTATRRAGVAHLSFFTVGAARRA